MNGLRHYETRLRRSRRRQYVVARQLIALVAVALVLFAILRLASGL